MTSPPGSPADREKRFEEVVAEYFRVAASGAPPTEEELRQRYPDLADLLRSFFADQAVQEANRRPTTSVESWVLDAPTMPFSGADTASQTDRQSHLREGSLPGRSATKVRGRRVGNYELLEEVAHGGMGVVYKARQITLNRIVALKMIRAGELASDEELDRFLAEAQAAAAFDHVGIVPIYEVGQHNGQPYYSMGFVEGTRDQSLVLDFETPFSHEDGATLSVTLKHGSRWKEANIGRFRLSITDSERPPPPPVAVP